MIVQTQYGKIKGFEKGGVAFFLGVPYACPSVENMRWKPPIPPEPWEDILDADKFGNASVQPSGIRTDLNPVEEHISEDCLYLNIWAPEMAVIEHSSLPVMVNIHGGGFCAFSSAYDILRGEDLAKQGIIVVSMNYRLGALGFLAHPLLSEESGINCSGNYGILDQIEALKWVKDNIANFGGDPNKVTISGESAGAFSVSVLCMSPLSKGLFRAAIAESGAFFDKKGLIYQLYDLKTSEEKGKKFFENFTLDEMRKISAQEILDKTAKYTDIMKPTRDGYVFPDYAENLYSQGRFADVPLLIGSNCDDGSQFSDRSGNKDNLNKILLEFAGEENYKDAENLYPANEESEVINAQNRLTSDLSFGHNMYFWARMQNQYGNADVYLYYYCYVPPLSMFGAHHSSELPYFFHTLHYRDKPFNETDYRLEKIFSGYIVNFVKHCTPNGEDERKWIRYREKPEQIMILDNDPRMMTNPTIKHMEFWDKCLSRDNEY